MAFTFFGEVMMRLTPSVPSQKLCCAQQFDVTYAGAEANVASSLAKLGHTTQFVTALPPNELGDGAVASLNSYGIDTTQIKRTGNRVGSYLIELGASIRPSKVVYDRAHSAISEIAPNEFDWHDILKNSQWLHLSGITPALSKQCAAETIKAAEIAQSLGVKVSFDMNFRRTLWQDVNSAKQIFTQLLKLSTLAHGNVGVISDVFGLNFDTQDSLNAALTLQDMFDLQSVAFTQRQHQSASINTLSGIFIDAQQQVKSDTYTVEIVDRFGSGDAFAAAILHGKQHNWSAQNTVDFGSAAFALKHTIKGDQHTSSEDDIQSIAKGNTSGHVIR